MRQLITIYLVCFAAVAAVAQSKADIEVSYNYRHFHRRGAEQNHQMVLLANATSSKFYNPITEYVDSLEATPEGRSTYKQLKMAAFSSGKLADVPKRTVPMYIFKNKDGNTDVFDGNITLMFQYTEPYEAQTWVISDSTKNILGYDCIMASADYHGRNWTVWFAPEIPIQDGPWKLSGLPGLILEAKEKSGQHHFTATGINATAKPLQMTNLGAEHYEKTDRISMLKALRKFEDNPVAGLNAALGVSVSVKKDIKIDKTLDFLETDYR